jgi:hypothetical protein
MSPADEARLFALDALRAARASWSRPADEGAAAMSVFVILVVSALFPDVLADPAGEP